MISVSELSIPSFTMQERKWHEITKAGAPDDPEEDPGVVGHDAQHQHVAQRHLQYLEDRLDGMQQPPRHNEKRYNIQLNTAASSHHNMSQIHSKRPQPVPGTWSCRVYRGQRGFRRDALQHRDVVIAAGRRGCAWRLSLAQLGPTPQPYPPHFEHLV